MHENTTIRDQLGRMITNLDGSINRFRNLSFSHTAPTDPSSLTATAAKHFFSPATTEETYDKSTENRLARSKDLRDRLYREKRETVGRAPG